MMDTSLAWNSGNPRDYASYREDYVRDGVVFIPNALNEEMMKLVDQAFEWRLDHLGPQAQWMYPEEGVTNLQAISNSMGVPLFIRLIKESYLTAIAAALLGTEDLWYWQEQLFLKKGKGGVRRTFWHQDTAYSPVEGGQAVVFWVNLSDVRKEEALEVVRGSHRGILYNGAGGDPKDDTSPLYSEEVYPRLPDIQAQREKWDIVSWDGKRGDILAFHPNALHGGAGTADERRTLSFRFIGEDLVRAFRPPVLETSIQSNPKRQKERGADDSCGHYTLNERINATLRIGEPIYRAGLPKVRSAPG